jgi:ketohexokinase
LIPHAQVRRRGFTNAGAYYDEIRSRCPDAILVSSWGEDGAFARDQYGNNFHSPAFPPARVIDTLGAGDTFNAGFINAMTTGHGLADALQQACRLAGRKVGQTGFEQLA